MLSIITVNLNNLQGLRLTAESVLQQTAADFEWIIIDGGSTDGSVAFIESLSDRLAYWQSAPDDGIYEAMNQGLFYSKGDYILFLNSGDRLAGDILSSCLQRLSGKDFEVFDIRVSNGTGSGYVKDLSVLQTEPVLFFLYHDSLPHQSTLIRRAVFDRCGLYNSSLRIVADWALTLKAFLTTDATLAYHRGMVLSVYDDGGVSSKQTERLMQERHQVLKAIPCAICEALSTGYTLSATRRQVTRTRIGSLLYRTLLHFT